MQGRGFFNCTSYEFSTQRNLRMGVSAEVPPGGGAEIDMVAP